MAEYYLTIALTVFLVAVLAVDMGVFQKKAHALSMKAAIGWSIFWVACALLFDAAVYIFIGKEHAVQFLSGYLVEKSLSVDNLFVFLLIFTYFQVPKTYQHKVLVWGILGAIVMRGVLIYLGIALIEKYHWLTYCLGAFLILTGLKTLGKNDDDFTLDENKLLRSLRRFLPVTKDYAEDKFLLRHNKRLLFTPLFIVLVMIETTDVLFALDSIPAILAITQDPFVLYTSNLFAILGLRALYFVLAEMMRQFAYLNYGVSAVLVFVGIKMVIAGSYEITEATTLTVIGSLLAASVLASVFLPKAKEASENASPS